MRIVRPLIATAALGVLAVVAVPSVAQPPAPGPRLNLPSRGQHLFSWERGHRLRGGVFIVEREVPVIVEREVVREVPAAAPVAAPAPAEPRKPYAVGATYAALPGGCMKLIEESGSYYFCGGSEWYRQLGDGSASKYRAVARP